MEQNIIQQLITLNQLYKESNEIYSGIASQLGLSDTSCWILYAISHEEGDCTQNDLCRNWFFPIQTVNSSVSNLQKKGLVRLEMIPGTKNRKRIILTEEGNQFIDKFISKIDEMEKKAFQKFTEEERSIYISLYQRHNENLRLEKECLFSDSKRSQVGDKVK